MFSKSNLAIFFTIFVLAIAAVSFYLGTLTRRNLLAQNGISAMDEGMVGAAYNQTMAEDGGVGPYTWTLAKGSDLPAGLTLNAATGVASGNPTVAGSSNMVYIITDGGSPALTATQTCKLRIAPEQIKSATTMLQGGRVQEVSDQTMSASGGPPLHLGGLEWQAA